MPATIKKPSDTFYDSAGMQELTKKILLGWSASCLDHTMSYYSRHVRAIPWPSGRWRARWRARRRIDTGHAGRLYGRERAQGHVQPRCRGGGGVGRGKGCRLRHRSGGGPRRRRAAPKGEAVTPPRSAPAHGGQGGRHGARAGGWDKLPRDEAPETAPLDGVSNRRRAAATEDGAQARSPV